MHRVIFLVAALVLVVMIIQFLNFGNSRAKENMWYLDQYELQDNYRNVPETWPVDYTSTTAIYTGKRIEKEIERRLSNPTHYAPRTHYPRETVLGRW